MLVPKMSAWKYRQLTPKVIVLKLGLIDQKDLIELTDRNLESISAELLKTPYQEDITDFSTAQIDSSSLEKALFRNFQGAYSNIIDCSPKDVKLLISTMQMKFEAWNVKAMLRSKSSNLNIDKSMNYILPFGKLTEETCRTKLEKSNTVPDLVSAMSDLEFGKILMNSLTEFEKTREIQVLEAAIDRYVYDMIWKATDHLHGLDRKISKIVLGIEIDLINLKTILRGITLGLSESQIVCLLLSSSEVFEEADWKNVARSADATSAVQSLMAAAKSSYSRDHQWLLAKARAEYQKTRSLSQLETVLDRCLLTVSLRMVRKYTDFFNVGSVLAFLNLKWFEIRNLRAIIRGAEANLSSAEIRKLLIFPY
ncbi:hypothetical protein A3K70_04710 [Candidatus Bathyarchaeota archaeon RBG_16_48_13]|nr:MAG: hypothetical protein A3K70_04710 [Candidatus Bathyarchaeota archaeon RBG_16_48_13]